MASLPLPSRLMYPAAARLLCFALFVVALLGHSSAFAHEFKIGNLRIIHPYALPSLAGVANGVAFVDFSNRGKDDDALVSISTSAAKRVEIHQMQESNGVMQMREISRLEVGAGKTVDMQASGLHLMLIDLAAPLKKGNKFTLTLRFAKAGEVSVEVWVQDKDAGSKAMHDHHQKP